MGHVDTPGPRDYWRKCVEGQGAALWRKPTGQGDPELLHALQRAATVRVRAVGPLEGSMIRGESVLRI